MLLIFAALQAGLQGEMMMRRANSPKFVGSFAICSMLAFAACGRSTLPVGSIVYVGQREAPFCDTAEQLQDLLSAMQANDAKWIEGASKNCLFIPEGTKLAIIQNLPTSVTSNAVQVRVFIKDVTGTGYTITEGFRTNP